MKFHCPAKINLFLKVIGKKDNYHQLESLFAFLNIFDVLEVEKSKKFKLEISGEFAHLINLENNLFTQILDFFSKEFSITKNLHIKIEKNIPVGAGLGGGSSNAAYFMMALNEIFNLDLSKKDLQKLSQNFGSDIAFFFEKKASIIKGAGEIIENFSEFKKFPILLINPKIHLATKDVFKNFDGNFSAEIPNFELQKMDIFELIKNFPNDLEKPAIELLPIIKEILDELKNSGAKIAKMSGSGASCFGIFEDENKLGIAKEFLNKKFPGFFIEQMMVMDFFN